MKIVGILEKIVEMYRFNNICIFYFNSISINAKVHTKAPIDEELFWVRMIDVQKGLGTKNKSDTVKKYVLQI